MSNIIRISKRIKKLMKIFSNLDSRQWFFIIFGSFVTGTYIISMVILLTRNY